jgi:hypothetical protein
MMAAVLWEDGCGLDMLVNERKIVQNLKILTTGTQTRVD